MYSRGSSAAIILDHALREVYVSQRPPIYHIHTLVSTDQRSLPCDLCSLQGIQEVGFKGQYMVGVGFHKTDDVVQLCERS